MLWFIQKISFWLINCCAARGNNRDVWFQIDIWCVCDSPLHRLGAVDPRRVSDASRWRRFSHRGTEEPHTHSEEKAPSCWSSAAELRVILGSRIRQETLGTTFLARTSTRRQIENMFCWFKHEKTRRCRRSWRRVPLMLLSQRSSWVFFFFCSFNLMNSKASQSKATNQSEPSYREIYITTRHSLLENIFNTNLDWTLINFSVN